MSLGINNTTARREPSFTTAAHLPASTLQGLPGVSSQRDALQSYVKAEQHAGGLCANCASLVCSFFKLMCIPFQFAYTLFSAICCLCCSPSKKAQTKTGPQVEEKAPSLEGLDVQGAFVKKLEEIYNPFSRRPTELLIHALVQKCANSKADLATYIGPSCFHIEDLNTKQLKCVFGFIYVYISYALEQNDESRPAVLELLWKANPMLFRIVVRNPYWPLAHDLGVEKKQKIDQWMETKVATKKGPEIDIEEVHGLGTKSKEEVTSLFPNCSGGWAFIALIRAIMDQRSDRDSMFRSLTHHLLAERRNMNLADFLAFPGFEIENLDHKYLKAVFHFIQSYISYALSQDDEESCMFVLALLHKVNIDLFAIVINNKFWPLKDALSSEEMKKFQLWLKNFTMINSLTEDGLEYYNLIRSKTAHEIIAMFGKREGGEFLSLLEGIYYRDDAEALFAQLVSFLIDEGNNNKHRKLSIYCASTIPAFEIKHMRPNAKEGAIAFAQTWIGSALKQVDETDCNRLLQMLWETHDLLFILAVDRASCWETLNSTERQAFRQWATEKNECAFLLNGLNNCTSGETIVI
jgi:hypothetical protein